MKRLSTLIALAALTATANASTVTSSFTHPLETTEINQTGTLDLFDSTLGTLLGASITVDGSTVMSFGGINKSVQSQNANIFVEVELFWSSALAALNSYLTNSILLQTSSGISSYAAVGAVGATRNFGPITLSGSNVNNLAGILGSLQAAGGGGFGVSCASVSALTVKGGGGNINTSQSTTANCGASITYTYEAATTNVPEPGSMALVGLALAGAGVFSRRRKKTV